MKVDGPLSNERGAAVNIVAWLAITYSCLAVIFKLLSKFARKAKLDVDDFLAVASMIAIIGFALCLNQAVEAGLGRHTDVLLPSQIQRFHKTLYASEILYLSTLAVSKATIYHLVQTLAPVGWVVKVSRYGTAVAGIWVFAGIFVVAFQCGLPNPWDISSGKCIDQTVFWAIMSTVDILTEVSLLAVLFSIAMTLQVSKETKKSVIVAFAMRICMIPLALLRVILLSRFWTSSDKTFDVYQPTMATTVHLTISIVTACLPFLKTFISSMQHGGMASDLQKAPQTQLTTKLASQPSSGKSTNNISKHTEEDWQPLRDLPASHGTAEPVTPNGNGVDISNEYLSMNETNNVLVETTISTNAYQKSDV